MILLKSFQDTTVGHICCTDQTLKTIVKKALEKERTKVDKHDEVRKTVMADLTNLYVEVQVT